MLCRIHVSATVAQIWSIRITFLQLERERERESILASCASSLEASGCQR